MSFLSKLILIAPATLVSIFAIVQGVIKLAKEIITACLNILVPLFPKTQDFIMKIRGWINIVDEWVEKIKKIFLNITGIKLE